MKKQFKIIIVFIILSIILIGCSNGEESGSEVNDDGRVDISIFSPVGPDIDLETNSFTKLVEEKFNMDIDWETTTRDSNAAAESRSISMASGDYPDVFLLIHHLDQFSPTELVKYGKQGALLPLNDLIKEYAPNIQEVIDNHEFYEDMVTTPDGNIYGLPQLNECYHCSYPIKMWMNKEWLDTLDLDIPTTHEEFKQVLKAFKTKDPNGNGKEDEVPFSSASDRAGGVVTALMNGFIYDDAETRVLLEDGEIKFAPIQPEWKEGLAFIKELYDEELIDSGAFSQNSEALRQLGSLEEPILGAGIGPTVGSIAGDWDSREKYQIVPPLEGPHASYSKYHYPVLPGGSFVITNKASEEAQIAAIKLIDYAFTEEGQLRAHFGEEGSSWIRPEEGDIAQNQDVEPIFKTISLEENEDPRNDYWEELMQYYQPTEFRDGMVQSMDIFSPEGFERRLQEATYLYDGSEPEEVYPYWLAWHDPEIADDFAMMQTNISDYIDQSAVEFIVGDKDLETGWDSYVEGFETLDLDSYLEFLEEAVESSN